MHFSMTHPGLQRPPYSIDRNRPPHQQRPSYPGDNSHRQQQTFKNRLFLSFYFLLINQPIHLIFSHALIAMHCSDIHIKWLNFDLNLIFPRFTYIFSLYCNAKVHSFTTRMTVFFAGVSLEICYWAINFWLNFRDPCRIFWYKRWNCF